MITVGKVAPFFSCDVAIEQNIKKMSLDDFRDSYKLIFFYPLDFTFVCPTELHALQDNREEFLKRNTEIVGVSVDSAYTHLAWLDVPRNKGGICGVKFPLVADITKSISRAYGVLNEDEGVALRGTFLLDKNNVVQYAAINNLPLGRNIAELLRIIDALAHVEEQGEVCPANWSAGKPAMKANSAGLREYFK